MKQSLWHEVRGGNWQRFPERRQQGARSRRDESDEHAVVLELAFDVVRMHDDVQAHKGWISHSAGSTSCNNPVRPKLSTETTCTGPYWHWCAVGRTFLPWISSLVLHHVITE